MIAAIAAVCVATVAAVLSVAVMFGVPRLINLGRADLVEFTRSGMIGQTLTLPIMVVVLVFFFLNPDVWQIAYRMNGTRMGLALLTFAAVLFLTGMARTRELLATVDNDMARDTSAVPWPERTISGVPVTAEQRRMPQLTVAQLTNVALALTGRQLAQALWVDAGVFAFLVLLGMVMVSPSAGEAWIDDNGTDVYWHLVQLPVSVTMVKVAVLLTAFAILYFVVVSTGEDRYRTVFADPFTFDLRRLLQMHAAYSAHIGRPARRMPWETIGWVLAGLLYAIGRLSAPPLVERLPRRWVPGDDPLFKNRPDIHRR